MHGLPHTAAFVVQFAAGAEVGSGRAQGRVEHIASGRTARFESTAALLAFIARVLEDVHASRRETP